VWVAGYRLAARAWAAYLAYGERGASAYVRGSVGGDDALPGLSDVDVAVVLDEDPRGPNIARLRTRDRWMRLRRAFRLTDLLLDYPLILEQAQLHDVLAASTFTVTDSAYYGPAFSEDKGRMLERPGLYGSAQDWRLMSGPERRPAAPLRDAQERRIAAWLELVYWWQWVVPACADPGPRTASLCVKLVSEPARIWLWLAHGWKGGDRPEVLRAARERLPEEEEGLRLALELHDRLPSSPDPPLGEILPCLMRMSVRIAGRLAEEVADEGDTEVRLVGTPDQVVVPHGMERASNPLPLCDWRSLVHPRLPDETFFLFPGDASRPESLCAASGACAYGPLPILRTEELMVSAGVSRQRTGLRALKCPLSDPVSFAVADARELAVFPNVAGWSAHDWARRAVAEHRAWLQAPPAPVTGLRRQDASGGVLAMLLTAARAGVFHESVCSDATPELPLTLEATARRLVERSAGDAAVVEDALERYREFAVRRTPPPQPTIDAFRVVVESLPAYLDPFRDPPRLLSVEQ
jgi:hypothetical protein